MSDLDRYREALSTLVSEAVERSLQALRRNHPTEELHGYAVLTDDGLSTLGYLAATRESLRQLAAPADWEPVDWTYDDGVEAYDAPREVMASRARAAAGADVTVHLEASFAVLVAALAQARQDGLFEPEVFLTVISTDPNELLESLEDEAVRKLNSPQVYAVWRAQA